MGQAGRIRHAEGGQSDVKLLRRIWHIILPPQCKCRIGRECPYIRSTIRECPVHGDEAL
jgi:hypothetical protein